MWVLETQLRGRRNFEMCGNWFRKVVDRTHMHFLESRPEMVLCYYNFLCMFGFSPLVSAVFFSPDQLTVQPVIVISSVHIHHSLNGISLYSTSCKHWCPHRVLCHYY